MKIAKTVMNHITQYDEGKIIRAVARYEFVSFDIFDTCIKRSVPAPQDVYKVVCKKFNDSFSNHMIDPIAFVKDRLSAARVAAERKVRSEEISLEDIYDCFPEKYSEYIEHLKRIEIECHRKLCFQNPIIKHVYDWCVDSGKKVIFTSDIFLDKETVESIINNADYIGYVRLFLSSDIGLKKSTGSLYKYILSELNILGKEIIHIGDNYRSDYARAKKSGWNTFLISEHPKRTSYSREYKLHNDEKINYRKLRAVMNGLIDTRWSDFYKYGFEVLGPLILGFCVWLNGKVQTNNINHLYFMARDGYLLKRAFEIVNPKINCTYLEVSRKSLGVPLMCDDNALCTLVNLNDRNKRWNCKMLCYRLGIEYSVGLNSWIECGLTEDTSITGNTILDDGRVNLFFDKIKSIVIQNAIEQKKLLNEYLREVGFDENSVVVDTGGNCTSQKYLNLIFNTNSIRGYYLWKRESSGTEIAEMFPVAEQELDFGNMSIVEYFLTAHEGTTLYYKKEGQTISAVHRDYEHDSEDMKIIDEVQAGILYLVKALSSSYGDELWAANVYKNNILLASQKPTIHLANMLGELSYYNDEMIEKIANAKPFYKYLLKPRDVISDAAHAGWKTGFLKRTLLLPFNYNNALRFIKSRK